MKHKNKLILLNYKIILFLFLGLCCGCVDEQSSNRIQHISYDPTSPNVIWRLMETSGEIEEFDVLKKKVLRKIPRCLKADEYVIGKIHVGPSYIIADIGIDQIFVFKKSDLSLFCTKNNLGKLIGKENMLVSKYSTQENGNMAGRRFVSITDERNTLYYFDILSEIVYSEKEFEEIDYTMDLTTTKYQKQFGSSFDTDKNETQKFFETTYFVKNDKEVVFKFKENVMPNSKEYLGFVNSKEGLKWKIPLGKHLPIGYAWNSDDILQSSVYGETIFINFDYKIRYRGKYSRRFSEEKIHLIHAFEASTGNLMWSYETYENSDAYKVLGADKK
jgi:hypothetical protein